MAPPWQHRLENQTCTVIFGYLLQINTIHNQILFLIHIQNELLAEAKIFTYQYSQKLLTHVFLNK